MTGKTYDYIVVGAGSAGSVIAARLTENSSVQVLLLEAGPAQQLPEMAIPAAWPLLLGTTANWGDLTPVQAGTGASILLGRGKALGGSSSINAMVFARGHRSGYDSWAASGLSGWGYDELLPYFKRSETAPGRNDAVRGTDGPLTVAPAKPPNAVIAALLDAAAEVGHPRAQDISSGLEEGFGLADLNVVDGHRQSAYDAYLVPALERPNLTVVTDARADRLIVEDGRCIGVAYTVGDDAEVSARVTGEVVVSAGAIGSPQLLMLSGIGPADHLDDVGVPVVLDLPGVGANLHDHPVAALVYESAGPVPPAEFNHTEAVGLVRSGSAATEPDLQIPFIDLVIPVPGYEMPAQGYTIAVSVMSPHSRGTVRLSSGKPGDLPIVDPNLLGDERDLDALVTGLRTARQIGEAQALSSWRGQEAVPGPAASDDAGLREYARKVATTYFHLVGTCAMGDGPSAVVDAELRVRGIAGLMIADGSVIPSIPSSNTNATICAIAEKAAELLIHA